jgi:hypothetical protein
MELQSRAQITFLKGPSIESRNILTGSLFFPLNIGASHLMPSIDRISVLIE